MPAASELRRLWSDHERAWRDPGVVAGQLEAGRSIDPRLLRLRATGAFWEVLRATESALLVTREYEHLVLALRAGAEGGTTSYMRLPHPSGLAVDAANGAVHVAATRNPNQIRTLRPATGLLRRGDIRPRPIAGRPLVPVATRFLPGCLYVHDLALVGGRLHANAVGENAVVLIDDPTAAPKRVWWPRSIERAGGPIFDRNQLQLNSIAAGPDLRRSFFSASTAAPTRLRPGHPAFAVDGRGVIFSGASREPVVFGLTRPHSARLHARQLWVDNSGYGELARVEGERAETVARLPGWTRGLCFSGNVAFVATSRVIPRFRQYAPGLDPARSVCGVHAVDTRSGALLGSVSWPYGYQIFSVELVPLALATGFPFEAGTKTDSEPLRHLFYAFSTEPAPARKRRHTE